MERPLKELVAGAINRMRNCAGQLKLTGMFQQNSTDERSVATMPHRRYSAGHQKTLVLPTRLLTIDYRTFKAFHFYLTILEAAVRCYSQLFFISFEICQRTFCRNNCRIM